MLFRSTFQRDVIEAWLQVNAGPDMNSPSLQSPSEKQTPSKPRSDPPQQPEKTAKAIKQAVPLDKDFLPPVQRFPFPDGAMITGGSGFIVDGGKRVVTNRHVVDGGKEFAVRTGLGEVIKAKLIHVSKTDDLAVLELDKPLPADRSVPSTA